MRILSVRVRNFRMHEDRTVVFDRQRTVVAGPNESGKSTLVDAIERVLCYPHRSHADNLEGCKPRAGGGPPEVILQFERGARTYTIHKIFKGPSSVAKLADDAGNQYTGDEAEERLRALLGFGENPLRNPWWGWTHLWARQGEAGADPTGGDALGPAAKDLDARLKSLAGTALTESKMDTAVYDRIAAEYAATFKQGDAARTGSPLADTMLELEAATDAASQAAAQLAAFEDAADTIVQEEALILESRGTLADAESQLARLRGTLESIEAIEQALANRQTEAKAALAAHAVLKAGDAEIVHIAVDIDARTKTLAPREQEIERLKVHERWLQNTVAECLDVIGASNESQRTVAAEEDLLRSIARVLELKSTQTHLAAVLEQIEAHRAAIAAIDARLRALPDVDKETVEVLETLDRSIAIGQGKLQASSTRIEVLVADSAVAVDGQPLAAGEWQTLTNEAEVTIGARTRLLVSPGGDASLITLRAEIARLDQELATTLAALGLRDAAEARTTLDRRLEEATRRKRHEEKLDALNGDDILGQLNAAAAEVERLEAEIRRKQPEGFDQPPDTTAVAAAIGELLIRRSAADLAVQRARTNFDGANGELKQIRQTRERLEEELSNDRRELQDLAVKKVALERVYGTDREARLRQLADDMVEKQDAAVGTERRLAALAPIAVRDDKDRLERTALVTIERINQAMIRKATAEGQLGHARSVDLHGAKAAAEARLEIARRRHAEVNNRAQAVRRLRELFEKQRTAVAEIVAAPLRVKVTEYLDQLYGPGTRVAVTKCGAMFQGLALSRQPAGGQRFDFEELSGGTREQVAAACRLAMAEILAGSPDDAGESSGGCLPIVFDDAFVNSDPERIKAVHRVLELGARRGLQIIVLSCNPQEYGLFGAKRVDLPPPKPREVPFPDSTAFSVSAAETEALDGEGEAADTAAPLAATGRVPLGDDATLAAAFVAKLAPLPDRKSGNKSLREQHLGWDEATYERIKELLIASGRIKRGPGKGGSVQLLDDGGTSA